MVSRTRLNVTLDEQAARKLAAIAARMHVNEGTLARSLLTTVMDESEPVQASGSTRSTVDASIPCRRRRAQRSRPGEADAEDPAREPPEMSHPCATMDFGNR